MATFKEIATRLILIYVCSLCISSLLSMCFFHLSFLDGTLVLIAPVPDHCLSPIYTFTVFSMIHHDSPRFLMVRKIGVDRDESWRKVEIFNVTTIPVRMSTILYGVCKVSLRINDGS